MQPQGLQRLQPAHARPNRDHRQPGERLRHTRFTDRLWGGLQRPWRGPGRSVGNEAIGFAPDNGVKRTTAWGLVFVR